MLAFAFVFLMQYTANKSTESCMDHDSYEFIFEWREPHFIVRNKLKLYSPNGTEFQFRQRYHDACQYLVKFEFLKRERDYKYTSLYEGEGDANKAKGILS